MKLRRTESSLFRHPIMKKSIHLSIPMTFIVLLCVACISTSQNMDTETAEILNGISNKGRHGNKYYLTPGDRTYIVGTQEGDFPDLGSHVQGEMGVCGCIPSN